MRNTTRSIYSLFTLCIGIASGALLIWGFSKLFWYQTLDWWKNLLFTNQGFETISMWIQLSCLGLTPVIVSVILNAGQNECAGFFTRLFMPIVSGFLAGVFIFPILFVISAILTGEGWDVILSIIFLVFCWLVAARPTYHVIGVIVEKR